MDYVSCSNNLSINVLTWKLLTSTKISSCRLQRTRKHFSLSKGRRWSRNTMQAHTATMQTHLISSLARYGHMHAKGICRISITGLFLSHLSTSMICSMHISRDEKLCRSSEKEATWCSNELNYWSIWNDMTLSHRSPNWRSSLIKV